MKKDNTITIVIIALMLLNLLTIIIYNLTINQQEKQIKELKNTPPVIIERDISPIPYDDLGVYTITYYCDCPICTKTPKGSKTATGVKPKEDITIACDGDILKMGDIVYIENIGVYICQDKGSAITNGRIDVFVNNHQEAVNLGVKKARVYKIGG